MYRRASYYKNGEYEFLQVDVFESSLRECLLLKVCVDFRCGLLKDFVIQPFTYQGHSFNLQFDELRRVHNFIVIRGWRKKIADYHILTSDRL